MQEKRLEVSVVRGMGLKEGTGWRTGNLAGSDARKRFQSCPPVPSFNRRHSPQSESVVVTEVWVVVGVVAVLVELLGDETQKSDVNADVEDEEGEDEDLTPGREKLLDARLGGLVLR